MAGGNRNTKRGNITDLYIAEQAEFGNLGNSPVFKHYAVQNYTQHGGELVTARPESITSDRRLAAGDPVGLNASSGFGIQLGERNVIDLIEGALYGVLNPKTVENLESISGQVVEVVSGKGASFKVGDIIQIVGNNDVTENNIFAVDSISGDELTVSNIGTSALTDIASPSDVTVQVVGFKGEVGDIEVTNTGSYARYTSTNFDFTTLGVEKGEFVIVGGDETESVFAMSANNGAKRVREIKEHELVVDKSDQSMVIDDGDTKEIQFFLGKVVKDPDNPVEKCFTIERQYDKIQESNPYRQADYVENAFINTFSMTFGTRGFAQAAFEFLATGVDSVEGTMADPIRAVSATRPPAFREKPFNTSRNVLFKKMDIYSATNEKSDPLFAGAQEFSVSINKNV